ncbi:MAG: hypothetical protein FWH23_07305 [Bacteroidales bacterium]|nr:hypothetical protein [Bacteroidales bacterium]
MICFDKLKIITSPNNVQDINMNEFQAVYKNGDLQYYKYNQKFPSLFIMKNFLNDELAIEITSKILKDNCINLINIDNIYECFENINKLNICQLNIHDIIDHSMVVKCDPCKDIVYSSIKGIKDFITTEEILKNGLVSPIKWIYITKYRRYSQI